MIASGGFWAFVGVVAGIYTIFALGLQLQFGLAGLLNFGQVAFMAIGAYTMAILVVKQGWSTWLAAPLGIAAAGAAGLLLGIPALRLRADFFAIVTIAFSEIVRYVATNEAALTGGSQGTIALGNATQAAQYNGEWERFQARVQGWLGFSSKDAAMLVIVWAVAIALLALVWLAVRTPWGRVLRAIREDEDAAASLGKNVLAYKLQALAIGSALAGVAGCFYAWQFSFFSPDDFAPLLTFFAWMIVLIGGLGRVWAVPVGALVFGFLFAGTRFLDFPPLSYLGRRRSCVPEADHHWARDHRTRDRASAGHPRETRRDGARVTARLEVRDVVRAFGGVRAVDGASFDVKGGSITGLIGPNGAGKSTLFNCISGFLKPQSGSVFLDGQRITAPHRTGSRARDSSGPSRRRAH